MSKKLEALERLRSEDPRRALRKTLRLLDEMDPADPELASALGILGSCYYALGEPPRASRALALGLRLAEQRRDLAARGDLCRRLGSVLLGAGELATAYHAAMEAVCNFIAAENPQGTARAMVDTAVMLTYLGKTEIAIGCYESALRHLNPKDDLHLCAAHQGLAHCSLERGDLDRAAAEATLAAKHSRRIGRVPAAKLEWLKGRILVAGARFEDAAEVFEEVELTLRGCGRLVDAAFVACDRVDALLAEGSSEAHAAAKSMAFYLQPMRGFPTLVAAITEVCRAALAARLDSEMVTAVRGALRLVSLPARSVAHS